VAEADDGRGCSDGAGPFNTVCGARLLPDGVLPDEKMDAVLLPVLLDDGCLSDAGYRPVISGAMRDWIRAQDAAGAIFAAFCSGVLVLADSGLLDGHACTLPETFEQPFRQRYPLVDFRARQSLVVSGQRRQFIMGGDTFYSSDVSLFAIRRFLGARVAIDFAKLYGKPFTEVLFARETSQFAEVPDQQIALAQRFIHNHFASPALVTAAAHMTGLSQRTFHRRFQQATGLSPKDFVLHQRMQFARYLLVETATPIEEIAAQNGYSDRAAFSRSFRKQTGLSPVEYRARFRRIASIAEERIPGG